MRGGCCLTPLPLLLFAAVAGLLLPLAAPLLPLFPSPSPSSFLDGVDNFSSILSFCREPGGRPGGRETGVDGRGEWELVEEAEPDALLSEAGSGRGGMGTVAEAVGFTFTEAMEEEEGNLRTLALVDLEGGQIAMS